MLSTILVFFVVKSCGGLLNERRSARGLVCGGVLENRARGIIESPNYPLPYPKNIVCDWLIKAGDPRNVILFRFIDVQLEDSNSCLFDYIEIGILVNGTRRFCKDSSEAITTKSNFANIRFSSDATGEKAGFRLAFKVVRKTRVVRPPFSVVTAIPITTAPRLSQDPSKFLLELDHTSGFSEGLSTNRTERNFVTTVNQSKALTTIALSRKFGFGEETTYPLGPSEVSRLIRKNLLPWQTTLIVISALSSVFFVLFSLNIYIGFRQEQIRPTKGRQAVTNE